MDASFFWGADSTAPFSHLCEVLPAPFIMVTSGGSCVCWAALGRPAQARSRSPRKTISRGSASLSTSNVTFGMGPSFLEDREEGGVGGLLFGKRRKPSKAAIRLDAGAAGLFNLANQLLAGYPESKMSKEPQCPISSFPKDCPASSGPWSHTLRPRST